MQTQHIKATNKTDTTVKMIPVYIMGKRYPVPETLTIMKAMEYAGYRFIRGCGCRGGICGACATVYRKPNDYHIYIGLACQTVVEPDMYLTQIPFYPANRTKFDFSKLTSQPEEIFKLYPELFRCLACNTCTKSCPMDVPVMDVVSALKRGNIEQAAKLSFSCIQCGLCVSRCMGELPHYHMFQLARRMYGAKIAPRDAHIPPALEKAKDNTINDMLHDLMGLDRKDLRKVYQAREIEPELSEDGWTPVKKDYI